MAGTDAVVVDRPESFVNDGRGGGIFLLTQFEDAATAVCRINIRRTGEWGTGFIAKLAIGSVEIVVLITNYHVVSDLSDARDEESTYDFRFNRIGQMTRLHGHQLFTSTANCFLSNHMELDYFIATVNTDSLHKAGLTDLRPIELSNPPEVLKSPTVFVIQHPKAEPKSISVYNSNGSLGPYLFYHCDTDLGSSGSPVLRESKGRLKLVALHRGGKNPQGVNPGYNVGSLTSAILTKLNGGDIGEMPSVTDLAQFEKQIKKESYDVYLGITDRGKFQQELIRKLKPIEARWKEFGNELEIKRFTIDNIKANFSDQNPEGACQDMFNWWEKSTGRAKRNWSTIKDAAQASNNEDMLKKLQTDLPADADDKEPKMKDLHNLVIPFLSNNWEEFGGHLGIAATKLTIIRATHYKGGNADCLRELIKHWCKVNADLSWKPVLEALDSMGEVDVKETIQDGLNL